MILTTFFRALVSHGSMGATMGAILKIGLFSTLNFGQILLPLPSSKGAQHI